MYQEADDRAHLLQRESLPSTKEVWLGTVIELYWMGGFCSADYLLQALDSIHDMPKINPQSQVVGDF